MGLTDARSTWVSAAQPTSPNRPSDGQGKCRVKGPPFGEESIEVKQGLSPHCLNGGGTCGEAPPPRKLELHKLLSNLEDVANAIDNCSPKLNGLLKESSTKMISQRYRIVTDLRCLNTFYGFHPETFMLAVDILDLFLSKVKVPTKYLRCASIACFLLAATEKEAVATWPLPAHVLKLGQCGRGCSTTDLARMQAIVASKVKPLPPVMRHSVVLRLHEALHAHFPAVFGTRTLLRMTSIMSTAISEGELLTMRSVLLAVAVVSYVLEELGLCGNLSIGSLFILLRNACNVNGIELQQCQKKVEKMLRKCSSTSHQRRSRCGMMSASAHTKGCFRPSTYGQTSLPAIREIP